jgi:hypothetical protein
MNDINYEHVLFGLLLIFEYGHHRNGLGLFHWPASVLPGVELRGRSDDSTNHLQVRRPFPGLRGVGMGCSPGVREGQLGLSNVL